MNWHDAKYWCHFVANRPYVYAVFYPNGLPFYVGKGKAERMIQHGHFLRDDLKAAGTPTDEKERIIKSLHENHSEEQYAVLSICDSAAEALQLEAVVIATWRRRQAGGLLSNADEGHMQREPES